MKIKLLLIFLVVSFFATAQQQTARVAFYNVENLFDLDDDEGKNDSEYLPGEMRYWSYKRLNTKLNRIFQVIIAMSNNQPPAIIGICEVENHNVLEMLLNTTPLRQMGYKVIHRESPDKRGIDVAMLYNVNQFTPSDYKAIPVTNPNDPDFKTRDILFVKGTLLGEELHLFVNHWPSKYGGTVETNPLRALAGKTLKHATDSLLNIDSNSKIIAMGDFNDTPVDESILKALEAQAISAEINYKTLYNLAYKTALNGDGSNKYQAHWDLIDQIIVSGSLLNADGVNVDKEGFTIFKPEFLLEKDKRNLGVKPNRTYIGYKYNNGFSDHLPVYIDIYK